MPAPTESISRVSQRERGSPGSGGFPGAGAPHRYVVRMHIRGWAESGRPFSLVLICRVTFGVSDRDIQNPLRSSTREGSGLPVSMEELTDMRTYGLKRKATPKIAVLATSVMVVTMNPALPAQALPSYHQACNVCHAAVAAGVSTAVPSATTMAPGAAYTVLISYSAGGSGLT